MSPLNDDKMARSHVQSQPSTSKYSPPPRYTANAEPNPRMLDQYDSAKGQGLMRRTSIRIESTPAADDYDEPPCRSYIYGPDGDSEQRRKMKKLGKKVGNKQAEAHYEHSGNMHADSRSEISIQESQPARTWAERHEMRGLEQAASMKRWPGRGRPAEAWGKLRKVDNAIPSSLMKARADLLRILSYGIRRETR